MSKQRYFIFNPNNCFGCNGCTAACVNVNQTTSEKNWRTVHKIPPENKKNNTLYISMSCNHCENPPCLSACPTNSYIKRESDGVVIHNSETCIGCKYCMMACPYDAIKWDENLTIVTKCHFCYERLDENEEPACVKSCFAGALSQVLTNDINEIKNISNEIVGVTYIGKVNPSIRFAKINYMTENKIVFPPEITINEKTGENNGK